MRTAVLSRFSRLLIDPNRGMDDPTLIMRLSDGAVVPGNRDVDEAERQRRIERFHRPYHEAMAAEIAAVKATGADAVPRLDPLLHAGLARRAAALACRHPVGPRRGRGAGHDPGFVAQGDLVVGDNEPYHGALEGDTLNTHGTRAALPHALIEIRQDLIAAKTGVDEWVERVAKVVEPIMYDDPQVCPDAGRG